MIGAMTGTRVVMAAIGMLVLGVSACSGSDPEPRVAPSPSSSTSTTASPSPPQPADQPVELVRRWIRAQNVALDTGNTTGLRSLADPSCKGCNDFVEPIERVYASGGSFDTAGWTVDSAKQASPTGGQPIVNAAVTISGGRTVPSKGADPVIYGEQKRIMQFRLVLVDGALLVGFVGFIQ